MHYLKIYKGLKRKHVSDIIFIRDLILWLRIELGVERYLIEMLTSLMTFGFKFLTF